MAIKVGDKVPSVTLRHLTPEGPKEITTDELFGGKEHQADQIMMLGDGNAEFTKIMGLELDRIKEGMGIRSQRYAMLVENGVVKKLNVEKPGEYAVSSAETMLEGL